MIRRLKNVTITLEDEVARWARMEAAKEDISLSRFLGEILKDRMARRGEYARAMRRALRQKPFFNSAGKPYLTREEAHDRASLR